VRFKDLADRKKNVTDRDLLSLIGAESSRPDEIYTLVELQVTAGTRGVATATLSLECEGEVQTQAAVGAGPVDAAFNAIDAIIQGGAELSHYRLEAVTEGNDALGEAMVKLQYTENGSSNDPELKRLRTYRGLGTDQDVIVASARAYLAANNRLLAATHRTPSEQPAAKEASQA
jgi:2-isopropylmalate synthase